jgi:hypothetical protein
MRRSQYQLFVDFAGMDIAITRHAARTPRIDSLLLIELPPSNIVGTNGRVLM